MKDFPIDDKIEIGKKKVKVPSSVINNVIENKLRKMVKEEMLKEASTSESFSQMKNLMGNGIPMIFKKEEGKLPAKYYYKTMQNGDVGVFIQRLAVGDPSAIKLWPKVSKVIKKNMDNYYKEDIMIKQKLNTERNKMWTMMGKFGKKLKV